MLTIRPCRKYFPGARTAMIQAQIRKIASQKKGSTFDGITKTVPTAIASPKRESARTSFQFMVYPEPNRGRSANRRKKPAPSLINDETDDDRRADDRGQDLTVRLPLVRHGPG